MIIVSLVAALSCQQANREGATTRPAPGPAPLDEDLTPVDPAADPCTDFARFACGPEVPPNDGSVLAYDALARRVPDLREFIRQNAQKRRADRSPAESLIDEFYRRCNDQAGRGAGLVELAARIDEVGKVTSLEDLARMLGAIRRAGHNFLISLGVFESRKGTGSLYIARLGPGAPILPRALYARRHHLLEDYRQHWRRLSAIGNAGTVDDVDAAARVDALLGAEKEPPASAAGETVAMFSAAALRAARFPWRTYFAGVEVDVGKVPLAWRREGDGEAIDRLAAVPLSDLKSYVRILLLERLAEYVSPEMLEEERKFHAGILHERPYEAEPLESICVRMVARDLEEPLAAAFLPRFADPPAEALARRLFDEIRRRASARVNGEPWLDDRSRSALLQHLGATTLLFVGDAVAPDLPPESLPPGSFLDLHSRYRQWTTGARLANLGQLFRDRGQVPTFIPLRYRHPGNTVWVAPELVRRPYVRTEAFNAISFGGLGTLLGWGAGFALRGAIYDLEEKSDRRSDASLSSFNERTSCFADQLVDRGWTRGTDADREDGAGAVAAGWAGPIFARCHGGRQHAHRVRGFPRIVAAGVFSRVCATQVQIRGPAALRGRGFATFLCAAARRDRHGPVQHAPVRRRLSLRKREAHGAAKALRSLVAVAACRCGWDGDRSGRWPAMRFCSAA